METVLKEFTVEEICKGFTYNELEEKGLFGLSGKLTIQPEYQRHYVYAQYNKEAPVIDSILRDYKLGLIYFNKIFNENNEERYEVLDGQQRITSIGRFIANKFSIKINGIEETYSGLAENLKKKILETKLLVYICEGTESEIKEWFRIINLTGVELNEQEVLNAVYSGPFVTKAKSVFSNQKNPNVQRWNSYVKGEVRRQQILSTALDWVSKGNKEKYMSLHRYDNNIDELQAYFNSVIDWVDGIFPNVEKEMCGLDWGSLYETYKNTSYNPDEVNKKVKELYSDYYVKDKKGIYEYILSGCKKTKLLEVRIFDPPVKNTVYAKQTNLAKEKGESNCPLCAIGNDNNKKKIWRLEEMDADHVTAWSKGGATDISNCQMLCKTHNRAKGNK